MRKNSRNLMAVSVLVVGIGVSSVVYGQYGTSPRPLETPGPSSVRQYADDAAITAKVKAALFSDQQLKATKVSVETDQGTVQLRGSVASKDQEEEAVKIANHIDGVRSVQDLLSVKGPQEP